MDPVEKVAQAIWEATPVAGEYPWDLLRGKLRSTMMNVAIGVITAVSREVDFLKNPNAENRDEAVATKHRLWN